MKIDFLFKQKKKRSHRASGKLTPEQRKEIARLHAEGVDTHKLGRMFGVSQSTAHYWANKEFREKAIAKMKDRWKNRNKAI